jgi:hypothetical protein
MCRAIVPISLLAALLVAGCSTRRDHTVLLKGIDTKDLLLEPKITRAPQLKLRVPVDFDADWTRDASYDSFILIDPDDDGDVQRAMLIINVTAAPVQHIDDTLKTGHTRSTLAGGTIEWHERSFVDEERNTIYQREAVRSGLFENFKDPKSGRDLVLQVFVVGTDSVLVERLMGSAETIVAGGGRPDA